MQRTKIEWTDYTWNPIKGLCPVDCKLPDGRDYCYARRMYQRFKWEKKPYFFYPEVMRPYEIKEPKKIFVCSTFELFHPITNTLLFPLTEGSDITYRDMVFKVIKENPQHIFQILTKFPQYINHPIPDNVWLGVTITKPIEMYPKIKSLYQTQAKLKFISFEPLLGDVGQFRFQGWLEQHVDWIIVGRLTGHGHKYDPKDYWITSLVYHAKAFKTPIFLKDNLKEIWREPLIQEFPRVA